MLGRNMYNWIASKHYVDGLVQERRNSIANALELGLSCTNPSMYADGLAPWGNRTSAGTVMLGSHI